VAAVAKRATNAGSRRNRTRRGYRLVEPPPRSVRPPDLPVTDTATTAARPFDALRPLQRGRALRRFRRDRLALVALAVLLFIVAAGLLARAIAPYTYQHFDIHHVDVPPLHQGHLFGTDTVGHDVFSRTLYAIRTSVLIGLVVAAAGGLLGVALGAAAGYFGGWLDAIVMWCVDFITAIPALGVLFTGVVLVGRAARPHWVVEVLILYLWTGMARVVRASVLSLREREYVEAARAAGASGARIVFRHLIPNASAAVLVTATALVAQTILLEATVEFFGFGFDPWVTPSLGALIADGTTNSGGSDIFEFWWFWSFPAIVLVLMLVCINFVGDSLDEALDPARGRMRS
jgi:ABC-type dipeptide/oligopeptide/nickel transport system permease subunit